MCGQCVVLFGNESLETARGAPIDLYAYRVEENVAGGTGKVLKFIVKHFIRHKYVPTGSEYSGFLLFEKIMGDYCFRATEQMRLSPNFREGNLEILVENGSAETHSLGRPRFSLEHPFLLGQLNFYLNIVEEPKFVVEFGKYNKSVGDDKFAFSYCWPKINQNKNAEKTFVAILPYYFKVVKSKEDINDFDIDRRGFDVVPKDKNIVLIKREITHPEDFAKQSSNLRIRTDASSLGFKSSTNNKIRLIYIEFKLNNDDQNFDKIISPNIFELDFRFEFVWKYKKDSNSESNTFSQSHKVFLLKPDTFSLIPDYSANQKTAMYPVSTRGHCEKNFIAQIKFSISSGSGPIPDLIRVCPFYLGSVSLDLADENLVIDTFDLANRPFKETRLSDKELSFETKIQVYFSLNDFGNAKFKDGYDLISTLHFYGAAGWKFASEKISLRFEKFKVIHEFVSFDFGTTNSCAVYWENSEEGSKPVFLQWGEGKTEIRSMVCANDHSLIDKVELNGWVCGKSAEKTFPPHTIDNFGIPNFKKLFQNSLRNQSEINIVDVHNRTESHNSQIALAGILKQFLVELENSNMVKFTNIGFTFPTKWDFNTVYNFNCALNILRNDSSLDVNIKIPEFDEGISVVFADYHGLPRDKKQKKTLFISYDLGGGTLDIAAAIMWQTRKGLNWQDHGRLIGYSGDNSLGGDLITEIITKLLCDSIADTLLKEDSVKTLFQTKKGLNPEVGKIDYLKSRIYFPNKYSNRWNSGNEISFDTENLKRYMSHNSDKMYKLADEIKITYFKKNKVLTPFAISIFVVNESNGTNNVIPHNIQIEDMCNIFPGCFDLSIDSFLDCQISLFGTETTARQKFLKSQMVLKKYIIENIDYVDCVRIILAGNGSRFQFVSDSIAEASADISKFKNDSKIEIIKPNDNSKKLAALGNAKKIASRIIGDFYPVYSSIQNPLFYTRTNTNINSDFDQIFENIFEPFAPFGKDILGDSPTFLVLTSRIISIVLADQFMVAESQRGYEFNIYSEKKDISTFTIGKLLIPNDLDPLFKKTKIIEGEEYPCVDVTFELQFSKSGSEVNGFSIRTMMSGFFIGTNDQRYPAVINLNGSPDSDYLSNILLMRE
jgi:hypothetical protein